MLRFLPFAHRYQDLVNKLVLFAYSEKERVTFTQHNYLRFSELQRFLEEGELSWKKIP